MTATNVLARSPYLTSTSIEPDRSTKDSSSGSSFQDDFQIAWPELHRRIRKTNVPDGWSSSAVIPIFAHGPAVQPSPVEVIGAEIEGVRNSIRLRLQALHEIAVEEDMAINKESEGDLRRILLYAMRLKRRPAITLLENGNLRAHWRDGQGQQIGLQFMGHDWIQYVIFELDAQTRSLISALGRDRIHSVLARIESPSLVKLTVD